MTEAYPTPFELIAYLNDHQKSELKKKLPNLDETYTINGAEFQKYTPGFAEEPLIPKANVTSNSVMLTVKLDNYGETYITALKSEENKRKPIVF